MKKFLFVFLLMTVFGCAKNQYTSDQQQDCANLIAELETAKTTHAMYAPPKVEMLNDGIADTSSMMTREVVDWKDTQYFLHFAIATAYSIGEEMGVSPLQMEYARMNVANRNFDRIAETTIAAKRQAGKTFVDKYSIKMFGIEFKYLVGGLAIFGVLAFAGFKYPAALPILKKLLCVVQIVRTETPLQIGEDLAKIFGIDKHQAAEVVRNGINNTLTKNTTEKEKKTIAKHKTKIGLKTEKPV